MSSFILSGCAITPPPPDKTTTKCKVNSSGDLECEIEVVWTNSANKFSNLQLLAAEDVNIDFSGSSTQFKVDAFNQNPTLGSISMRSNGVTFATKAASYSKAGQKILASDGQDLSDWMGNYNGQADEIVLTINSVVFDLESGNNSVVSVIKHNNTVLSGSSDSYYNHGFANTAATFGGSN